MSERTILVKLTPYQAKVLWGIVDGAVDAGACKDGLSERESEALNDCTTQLLRQQTKWKNAQ